MRDRPRNHSAGSRRAPRNGAGAHKPSAEPSATPHADLARRCAARGIPLTEQRRLVYETLLASDQHPTADDVWTDLRRAHPRISLATVYRTLETLVGLGLVHRVAHPGASIRFDAKITRHHHLLCDECGRMCDVESESLDAVALPRIRGAEIFVRDHSFQLRGLCPACTKAKHK